MYPILYIFHRLIVEPVSGFFQFSFPGYQVRAGIGHSNVKNGLKAGSDAAKQAMEAGRIKHPSLAFAFCGVSLDEKEFFDGLRKVIPEDTPIVGGTTIGIITNHVLCYEKYPAAVAIIEDSRLRASPVSVGNLDGNEEVCGRKLAEKLKPLLPVNLILVFYDSLKRPATASSPPVLNSSARLLRGLNKSLNCETMILGAGLIGQYEFGPTKQFCGFSVREHSVVALALDGAFRCYHRIMHGCRPLDGIYHTVTRIEDDVIYEIDGLPAAEVVDDLYGSGEWRKEHPVKLLTIGINYGGRFEDFKEENYVNRLITGVMPDGKSIAIFEPDLEQGLEFQFMVRDSQKMIESARENSRKLVEEIKANGEKALFALYVDCAGRTADFSQSLSEEAAEVQEVCNEFNVPLLGFYSGVEIAPFLGTSKGLDWTGVLIIIAGDKNDGR